MIKRSKIEKFLIQNNISEKIAIKLLKNYLKLFDHNKGGRPKQKHYLYISFRIKCIKNELSLNNKEAIAHYIKSGMAEDDHKLFGIKILRHSSYENILHKVRNIKTKNILGIGSLAVIPEIYNKNL